MPNEVDIDSLNIQISGDATKADTSLEKLGKTLSELKEVSKGVATRLNTIAKAIGNIASGNVEAANKKVKGIVNQYKELGSTTATTEKHLKGTSSEMRGFARDAKAMGLGDLAKELSGIGKNIDISNIDKYREGLDEMADALYEAGKAKEAARIREIAEDPIKAQTELKNLAEQVKSTNDDMARQEKEAAAATAEAAKIAAKEKANAERENQKEIEKSIRQLEKMQEKLRNLYERKDKMDFLGVSHSSNSYKGLIYDIQNAEADLAKFTGTTAKLTVVEEENEKEAEKVSKETRSMGKAASTSSSGFKRLWASIMRIAFYRAIRTAIKNITSSIKEGLTNLYTYSQEVGTAFAPAVDNLKNHVMLLKNAFATALRPVLEALIPVVIQLVDWFSKLADFVAQVLSVLFGKTDENGRYTKAVLGDLKQSNKEAKELRRTLLGFDEINRLDGESGGGTQQAAASTQFVQADVSEKAKTVADFIKNIDWDQVKHIAAIVLQVLAAIGAINLISKLGNVWKLLKTIGSVLGSIGKSVLGFATAHPILTAIIALVVVLGALLGDKIAAKIDEIQLTVDNFFDSLDSEGSLLGSSVVKLLKDIFDTVAGVLKKIFSAVYKLFHGDFKGAARDLISAISVLVAGIVNILIDAINLFLGVVSDVINAILYAVTWLWNNGIQPVLNTIVMFTWNKVIVPIQNGVIDLIVGFLTLIKDTWNAIADWLNERLNSAIEKLNEAIRWINDILGWSIPEIPLDVIPKISDESIKKIESQKFEPIKEDVDLIPKIKDVPTVDLTIKAHLDAKDVERTLNRWVGITQNNLNQVTSAMSTSASNQIRSGIKPNLVLEHYASGGFPTAGSLFVAGENGAGPEIVGNFGGRTAVLNSDQMAAAMYNAVSEALQNNPQGGGDIYLDGEVIYRNTVRRNNNVVRSTGRSALLT